MHVGLLPLMSPHKIDIAEYLSRLESEDIRLLVAMGLCLEGFADELKTTLAYQGKIRNRRRQRASFWKAIAQNVGSSWEWIFMSIYYMYLIYTNTCQIPHKIYN
jgi:hypothetical protein